MSCNLTRYQPGKAERAGITGIIWLLSALLPVVWAHAGDYPDFSARADYLIVPVAFAVVVLVPTTEAVAYWLTGTLPVARAAAAAILGNAASFGLALTLMHRPFFSNGFSAAFFLGQGHHPVVIGRVALLVFLVVNVATVALLKPKGSVMKYVTVAIINVAAFTSGWAVLMVVARL